jgi:hypothetical protein
MMSKKVQVFTENVSKCQNVFYLLYLKIQNGGEYKPKSSISSYYTVEVTES